MRQAVNLRNSCLLRRMPPANVIHFPSRAWALRQRLRQKRKIAPPELSNAILELLGLCCLLELSGHSDRIPTDMAMLHALYKEISSPPYPPEASLRVWFSAVAALIEEVDLLLLEYGE